MHKSIVHVEIDKDIDAELERALPKHFGGPRKAVIRVHHVCREWLDQFYESMAGRPHQDSRIPGLEDSSEAAAPSSNPQPPESLNPSTCPGD